MYKDFGFGEVKIDMWNKKQISQKHSRQYERNLKNSHLIYIESIWFENNVESPKSIFNASFLYSII